MTPASACCQKQSGNNWAAEGRLPTLHWPEKVNINNFSGAFRSCALSDGVVTSCNTEIDLNLCGSWLSCVCGDKSSFQLFFLLYKQKHCTRPTTEMITHLTCFMIDLGVHIRFWVDLTELFPCKCFENPNDMLRVCEHSIVQVWLLHMYREGNGHSDWNSHIINKVIRTGLVQSIVCYYSKVVNESSCPISYSAAPLWM